MRFARKSNEQQNDATSLLHPATARASVMAPDQQPLMLQRETQAAAADCVAFLVAGKLAAAKSGVSTSFPSHFTTPLKPNGTLGNKGGCLAPAQYGLFAPPSTQPQSAVRLGWG